ncbi:restriction endonuclease subunit S [Elstera cyanobacteriorum]|uniref:restriction endonuclease subunit S n=1 Tax=Elstera cyanobacteriorum TaxID=2022747 RepID=UPI002355ACD7|nr:restriction endonuclease subunit S [Elstera cyanobacteriorum]MCK6444079.1 restriction endonuclease subunit S [Elstera cyanobacteriorum]
MSGDLPKGWVETSIGSITAPYASIDPTKTPNKIFRYIDIGSIDNERLEIKGTKEFLGKDAPSRARRLISFGDTIFSTVRTYLRNIAFIQETHEGYLTSTGIAILRPVPGVVPQFLFRYVSSQPFVDAVSQGMDGTMYPAINDSDLDAHLIPLPPTAEQRRIVAKIDALFARSSRAREALAAIPALIDRYRQAVLAAAFRGDLTADWRDGESPMWQEVEACQLFEEGPTNGYSPKAATDGPGTKSLKLSATTTGTFILNDRTTKRLLEDVPPGAKFWLYPGDILIQRANSLEYVGATAIFDGPKQQYIYPDLMMRVRIKSPTTRLFFWRYMNSLSARNWLKERATGTAGNMPKISGSILKKLPVPLPPEDEQAEIILRIEERFAAIDTIARQIRQAANYVTRLDQSILDKAFSGRLVPQDPADEPAAQLLERIRAARAAARNPKRGRRARG